jgi:hypothetical protein
MPQIVTYKLLLDVIAGSGLEPVSLTSVSTISAATRAVGPMVATEVRMTAGNGTHEALAADRTAVVLFEQWEQGGGWRVIGLLIDSTLIDKS